MEVEVEGEGEGDSMGKQSEEEEEEVEGGYTQGCIMGKQLETEVKVEVVKHAM